MAQQLPLTLKAIGVAALVPLVAMAASCASVPRNADTDRAALEKELVGKVAEKPRSCIPLVDANGAKIYEDAIVYRASRRLSYVNDAKGCRSFDPDPIFVSEVRGSQLCHGDLIRLVSRTGGIPGPFCVLGDFTPYRAPR